MGVLLLIDRPGLIGCLADRGLAIEGATPAVVVGAACDFALLQQTYPSAAIMVLAENGEAEAAALDKGASDAAPVTAADAVIAARIARLVDRSIAPTRIEVGDLVVDRLGRAARRAGRALRLLPREFALLDQLASRAGETVSKAELHRALCGLSFHPGTNVLAVHVSRLRAALDGGAAFPMLHTDRGVGYRLVAAPLAAG